MPFDIECPEAPHLDARLTITERVLVDWFFNEVAPEVMLEELHTASELILEGLVNRRAKKMSFAELVAAAQQQGLFEGLDRRFALEWELHVRLSRAREDDVAIEVMNSLGLHVSEVGAITGRDLLLSLKDLRKEVRHRAAPGAKEWLDRYADSIMVVLEELAPKVRE